MKNERSSNTSDNDSCGHHLQGKFNTSRRPPAGMYTVGSKPTPPPSPALFNILHFNMPEVSQRQCGRHLSKSYRVLASRHAKLHSIKMTPFLLVNQKSFHVDEPPDELVRVCVCGVCVRQSFNCQKTRGAWKINNICRDCLNRFDKAHKSVLCKTICSNEK